eukprot:1968558-Pleurochrysis_carterae.AAC.3
MCERERDDARKHERGGEEAAVYDRKGNEPALNARAGRGLHEGRARLPFKGLVEAEAEVGEQVVELPAKRDVEKGEDEEPEEAVDEEEDEHLDDEAVLMALHRAVVLEAVERAGELVPDDPIQQLEADAPGGGVGHVEAKVGPQAHLRALDPKVARVEDDDKRGHKDHLAEHHKPCQHVLESALPVRVVELELARDGRGALYAVEVAAHDVGRLLVADTPVERQLVRAPLPQLHHERAPDGHERGEEGQNLLDLRLGAREREAEHADAEQRRNHQRARVKHVERVVKGDLHSGQGGERAERGARRRMQQSKQTRWAVKRELGVKG